MFPTVDRRAVTHRAHCSGKISLGSVAFRLEDNFRREDVPLDRGTMSRWMEDTGATLGATIVKAMRDKPFRTAFCVATDATGIAVQPVRSPDKHNVVPAIAAITL